MRRIKLVIAYDGGEYHGFQRLPKGPLRSVQGTLEAVLSKILNSPVRLKAAGRTDAGVHALGQVVAFDTSSNLDLTSLLRGANALLPLSIRVLRGEEVNPQFHPRFWAKSRLYRYFVLPECKDNIFFSTRVWMVPFSLDIEAMRKAAAYLVGRHDFSAYCSRVPRGISKVRNLKRLEIRGLDDQVGALLEPLGLPWGGLKNLICFELEADSFLRRMVRMLVASLVEVGCGRWGHSVPAAVLSAGDPAGSAPPAPACGLYLVEVKY